jgi:hypothetical protein
MFEADPLTMATLATDTARMALQAGPPTDVAGQAPGFVQNVLGAISAAAGDAAGGIGETISGMTPGGGAGAENAPGR